VTDIAFYHLQRSPLEQALPRLLEKTLAAGKRAVVLAGSEERVESLATTLWTYHQDSWLPHGTAKDGEAQHQPIWLSPHDENPNGATFLFLTDSMDTGTIDAFERCFDLFDGNDEAALAAARQRWKQRKEFGHVVTYWQQTDHGGWEQKA